jgi:hypothetical protein
MLDKNKIMWYNKEVKNMTIKLGGQVIDDLVYRGDVSVSKKHLGEYEEVLKLLETQVGMLEDINNRLQKCVVGETISVESVAPEGLVPNVLGIRLSRLEDKLGAVIRDYSDYVDVIEEKLGKMALQG